ncbi:MAG: hypothetical protein ACXABY_06660 [Candidatus Thorarchaeota archaeon]
MTALLNSIIDLVHPTVSGINVIISDTIWVLFDREVDEESVKSNLFISGPDQDTWSGPDLLLYPDRLQQGDESDILSSPDYGGFVAGEFTFEKINVGDLDSYSGWDYGGHGSLWRTKATFTPDKPLTPNTEYRVYVAGDEDDTDDLKTGIKTRTIFDVVNGANLGTGEATFVGSYTGTTSSETFHVKITTAGAANVAKFLWYRGSAPLLTYGPYTAFRGEVALDEGVSIRFLTGDFEVNDAFSVVVKAPVIFTGNLTWPFTTGTGSIQELPDTVSTDLVGAPSAEVTAAPTTFEVSTTIPPNRATDLVEPFEGDMTIILVMNDDVDETTVTTDTIKVEIEPVNGDDSDVSGIQASGVVTPTISVSDDEITLTIASGIIQENNVITVTVDDAVASTAGIALDSDYEFYFTSTYDPMYSSWRRVMLDYGAYLTDIARDTINLAIFEASLTADSLSWALSAITPTTVSDYYNWARREFATCKAAETLLLNALGLNQGLKSKRLGDLEVQYDQDRLEEGLEKALGCMGKYEATLHGKGLTLRKPQRVVKGSQDVNQPPIGRGWTPPERGFPVAKGKKQVGNRWHSGYYSSKGRTSKD